MTAVMSKETKKSNLDSKDVEQRVAILKRFKVLLSQQRDRFEQYMGVLDTQEEIIKTGNPDQLIAHVELEEQIVEDIFSIQKVIEPLEVMYQTTVADTADLGASTTTSVGAAVAEAREVPKLRAVLEDLRAEAVVRSDRNRELLAERMKEIRAEMKLLKSNPYAIHHSTYMEEGPALIDIEG
jgi:hypothetical protein